MDKPLIFTARVLHDGQREYLSTQLQAVTVVVLCAPIIEGNLPHRDQTELTSLQGSTKQHP